MTAQSVRELLDRSFMMKVTSALGNDTTESSTLITGRVLLLRCAELRDVLRRLYENA